jgi:hypothetical protein
VVLWILGERLWAELIYHLKPESYSWGEVMGILTQKVEELAEGVRKSKSWMHYVAEKCLLEEVWEGRMVPDPGTEPDVPKAVRSGWADDNYPSFRKLLEVINWRWEIGQTYTFSVIRKSEDEDFSGY